MLFIKYRIEWENLAWINTSWSIYDKYIGAFLINSVIEEIWVKISMGQITWEQHPIRFVHQTVKFADNLVLKIKNWLGKPDMNKLLMVWVWWIGGCISDKMTNRGDFSEIFHEPGEDDGVRISRDFSSQSTPLRRFSRRTWFADEICMQALWLGRCHRVCTGGGYNEVYMFQYLPSFLTEYTTGAISSPGLCASRSA